MGSLEVLLDEASDLDGRCRGYGHGKQQGYGGKEQGTGASHVIPLRSVNGPSCRRRGGHAREPSGSRTTLQPAPAFAMSGYWPIRPSAPRRLPIANDQPREVRSQACRTARRPAARDMGPRPAAPRWREPHRRRAVARRAPAHRRRSCPGLILASSQSETQLPEEPQRLQVLRSGIRAAALDGCQRPSIPARCAVARRPFRAPAKTGSISRMTSASRVRSAARHTSGGTASIAPISPQANDARARSMTSTYWPDAIIAIHAVYSTFPRYWGSS